MKECCKEGEGEWRGGEWKEGQEGEGEGEGVRWDEKWVGLRSN